MRSCLTTILIFLTIVTTPSVALERGNYTDTGWEPVINGCSDKGFDNVNPLTNFTESCNNHDVCYRTLGKFRAECESEFLDDMVARCDADYGPATVELVSESACGAEWYEAGEHAKCAAAVSTNMAASAAYTIAKAPLFASCLKLTGVYFTGVEGAAAFGSNAYKQGQEEARLAALEYAQRWYGGVSSAMVTPENANVFIDGNSEIDRLKLISRLYKDEGFPRDHSIPVTEEMVRRALSHSYQSTYLRTKWQYLVVQNMKNNVYADELSNTKLLAGDLDLTQSPVNMLATEEAKFETDLLLQQIESDIVINDFNAATITAAYSVL